MQYLRAVLARLLVQRILEACAPRGEGPRRDVELQQLLVDAVYDGRDECLDVFRARY